MIELIPTSQIKIIASLSERKYRKKYSLFKVEGSKAVTDTIGHFSLNRLVATSEWFEAHAEILDDKVSPLCWRVTNRDMSRMSTMTTAPQVIAVYELPLSTFGPDDVASDELVLAVDGVQDPGNLGTILRTCDWFGIRHVVCSNDTVDVYNHKTIQATMGAIARVSVTQCDDLVKFLSELGKRMPVYVTMLDGENVFAAPLTSAGVIVVGNEGSGIRPSTALAATHRLTIPSFASVTGGETSESLNVGVATAIVVAQFRSRQLG